ncbi:integrase [Gossypium australe]|uniref:Integrase n=1 Tax=Gossypium australe TaxID=47621 RepID=A0A5B6WQN2_9ROSI|nr:integrase [Gossypium australe]
MHPQIDDKYERVIQILDDMLRYYVLEFKASDWHKWYADLKRKDIGFQIGDRVFLKVSPSKRIPRCVAKRKRRSITYRLELPSKLEQIHNVFQLSMLRSDHSYIISSTYVEI